MNFNALSSIQEVFHSPAMWLMRGTQEPLAQSSMQSGLEEEEKKIQLMAQDSMRQSAITPDSYNGQSSPHEKHKERSSFMLVVVEKTVRGKEECQVTNNRIFVFTGLPQTWADLWKLPSIMKLWQYRKYSHFIIPTVLKEEEHLLHGIKQHFFIRQCKPLEWVSRHFVLE